MKHPPFSIALFLLVLTLHVARAGTPGADWNQATAAASWSARDRFPAVLHKSKFYVLGGEAAGGVYLNDVWSGNDGATWRRTTAAAAWSPRCGHAALSRAGWIWLFGGNDGAPQQDVWRSKNGKQWSQPLASAAWTGRWMHAALVFDNKIWILGGYGGGAWLNDVWSSSDGIAWTLGTAAAPWAGRGDFTATVFSNRMWIAGGVSASNTLLNDVWSSDDGTNWMCATAAAPWAARRAHAAASFDGRLWVLGGCATVATQQDVWASVDGTNWALVTPAAAWSPRGAHASAVNASALWILGGVNAGLPNNDVWYSTRVVLTSFVNAASANAVRPYTSWATAASNIQDAVNVVADYDAVIVSSGVYNRGGAVTPGFTLSNRVVIAKQLTVRSASGPGATVIAGGNSGMRGAYLSMGATLIGFTIDAGTTAASGDYHNAFGAGALVDGDASISNCILQRGRAYWAGGAFLVNGAGAYDSTFAGNHADSYGGVLCDYDSELLNCTIAGNTGDVAVGGAGCWRGSIISESRITRNRAEGSDAGGLECLGGSVDACVISNNTCKGNGGGARVADGGVLTSSTLSRNSAAWGGGVSCLRGGGVIGCTLMLNTGTQGGGVYADDGAEVGECVITNNSASDAGGGAYAHGSASNVLLRNCLITGNSAGTNGGGAYCDGGARIHNCTVSTNRAGSSAGGIYCTPQQADELKVWNSIIWGNAAPTEPNYHAVAATSVFVACCATPNPGGVGCIAASPSFDDPVHGNYRLLPASPCVNAGTNLPWMTGATDLDGGPRICGPKVDMGCYELVPEPGVSLLVGLIGLIRLIRQTR